MNSCEEMRELLVLYHEGALEPEVKARVEMHLAGCDGCREEAAQISRIRGWLSDSELFEPVQDLNWQMLPGKLAARAGTLRTPKTMWSRLRSPAWSLSAAALVLLACGLLWTLRMKAPVPGNQPAAVAAGNEAFLARMRAAYAREATGQYLAGCQSLLLDLISTGSRCEGGRYDVSLEVARARQLLQEKRMLDSELNAPGLAHARPLCDDLESLLVNLSTSQECETQDAIQSMGNVIEQQQLLLRINVVQSGISLE